MARTRKAKGAEKNQKKHLPRLLWEFKWRCHWCGVNVVRPPSGLNQNQYKVPPNMATADHLYDRNDIRRYLDERTRVLSCFKCNQGNRTFHQLKEWFQVDIIDIRNLLNDHNQ